MTPANSHYHHSSAPSKRKTHWFWWQASPIAAGIAAARIIRHGIAAQTNSAARFWRKDGGCESLRRELQIERNIAANTPAVTTEHIIRIANLISCTSESAGALALHLHQLAHRHHVVVVMSHDHDRAENNQASHKHAEGQGKEIVSLIRSARNVEEERSVHAHLRK